MEKILGLTRSEIEDIADKLAYTNEYGQYFGPPNKRKKADKKKPGEYDNFIRIMESGHEMLMNNPFYIKGLQEEFISKARDN